jgi:dihydrodipicolinate synthase/N-acetylneuraminate lyase
LARRRNAALSWRAGRSREENNVPLRADCFGLSVALATPFADDRSIDLPRLVAHARQPLAEGCRSVTVFGTTGEGASLGLTERHRAEAIEGIEDPRIDAMMEAALPYAITAGIKTLVGWRRDDARSRMRAPLKSLGQADVPKPAAAIDAIRAQRAA